MRTQLIHIPCTFLSGALAVCCAATAFAAPTTPLKITPVWTCETHMVMESAPIVADLDRDGRHEVLTAAYENLIVVDGRGRERWRFDARGRYSTCAAVLERPGQGPLIIAGDNTGQITCLDGKGEVVWQAETAPIFCASGALGDFEGDGVVEFVQGDKSGNVNVLDALTGAVRWKKALDGECSSAALGDLNGDSTLEIVIATGKGHLYALGAGGDEVWRFELGDLTPDWGTCSPILWRDQAGAPRVSVANGQGRLFCLDGSGAKVWMADTRGAVASTLSAADFDVDGLTDIFAVTQLGVLHRYDETGRALWDIDTQGRSLAPGALVDIDGDKQLEYVLATQNGSFFVFGQEGEVLYQRQFDHRTINVTPAFGEIDKSRRGLEFALTGGETGKVICFNVPALAGTAAPWRTYRADNQLTGAAAVPAESEAGPSMRPENLAWDAIYTGEPVRFVIAHPRPGDAPVMAEARCTRPDGTRQTAVGKVSGDRGWLQLPLDLTAPGPYQFAWDLRDDAGKVLAQGERELSLQPFANDQALVHRALRAMREAKALPASAPEAPFTATLEQEAAALQKEFDALVALQETAPGAPENAIKELRLWTAATNTRARRALALANLADGLYKTAPKTELVAFEGITWENRAVNQQTPVAYASPLAIARRCVPGEHVPVSIKLFNVTTLPAKARCAVTPPDAGPFAVQVFEVKGVPSNQNVTAWDPMLPLGAEGIEIPSLETREVWVDIDTTGVAAGAHTIGVGFDTGASQLEAQISLDVLPFEMAGPGMMRLCAWASYNEHAVRDLLAHGANVFITALPSATVTEGDPAAIAVDFTALDAFVAPLKDHDVFLLLQGTPDLGVKIEEEACVPRLADYFKQVYEHLAAQGFDEEHVALYTHDEPGGNGWNSVNQYVAFGRQALKARPGIKFYVNGGGDLPMFEALNEIAGIWSPSYYMLPEKTPEMALLRKSGKALWSYDCSYAFTRPIGWNTKTINIVAQYWLAAIAGMHYGATGIGYWCYNIGPSMWESDPVEFPLVYTNPDGTITTSRRWEAVREGMEDMRILAALRGRLDDPALSPEAKTRIERLLSEMVAGIADTALGQARTGAARYVIDAANNDGTVARLRNEMLACVALAGK